MHDGLDLQFAGYSLGFYTILKKSTLNLNITQRINNSVLPEAFVAERQNFGLSKSEKKTLITRSHWDRVIRWADVRHGRYLTYIIHLELDACCAS